MGRIKLTREIVKEANRMIMDDFAPASQISEILQDKINNVPSHHLLPSVISAAWTEGKFDNAVHVQAAWTLMSLGLKTQDDAIDGVGKARDYICVSALLADLSIMALTSIEDTILFKKILSELLVSRWDVLRAQRTQLTINSNINDCIENIVQKTGNYFSSACKVGMYASGIGENNPHFKNFCGFGLALGIAVQIGDDISDIIEDIDQKTISLPIVIGLEDKRISKMLLNAFDEPENDGSLQIQEMLKENGSVAKAEALQNAYIHQAHYFLELVKDEIPYDIYKHLQSL